LYPFVFQKGFDVVYHKEILEETVKREVGRLWGDRLLMVEEKGREVHYQSWKRDFFCFVLFFLTNED
jgi:hypothetical protein